jgi:hypothetical protein
LVGDRNRDPAARVPGGERGEPLGRPLERQDGLDVDLEDARGGQRVLGRGTQGARHRAALANRGERQAVRDGGDQVD